MLDLYFEILYVEILLWQAPCDDRANESSDYVISKISRILEMKKNSQVRTMLTNSWRQL
jgi:hypothetical protein